jgi:ABC-type nitrate/sulfonate/bicarbonate transport system substrate-binding protein
MTQLAVGLVAPIFNNMPVWAAGQLGLFADAGLAVTATVLYGVQNVTSATQDGSVDVGFGTPEGVLGNPEHTLTIVAGNARKLANGLIARRGLTSVTDLRGGTVGVSHLSEGTALLATEMLGAHGLQPGEDYQLKAIGVASARWELIQRGELDAGLQTPPHKYIAEDEGYPNLGEIADYVPDYQFTTLNVRKDWAHQHGDELRAFLSALARATQWLYDEPVAATALATEVLGTTPEYARRDYEHFASSRSLTPDLALSDAGMAKVIEVMHRAGTLAEDADWQQQVDLSYLPC